MFLVGTWVRLKKTNILKHSINDIELEMRTKQKNVDAANIRRFSNKSHIT